MPEPLSIEALLLGHSQELLLAVHPNTLRVMACNPHAAQVLGYAAEDLLGLSINEIETTLADLFYWESVRQGSRERVDRVDSEYRLASGELMPMRKWVRTADGPQGICMVVRAVPALAERQAEEALARSMVELRTTLEATADGILAMDAEGRVVNFNRRFAAMWQLPPSLLNAADDAEIQAWLEAQIPDAQGYRRRLDRMAEVPEDEFFDVLTLNDGRVFERTCRPQWMGDRVVGRVFSFTDVTARARAEAQLREARDQAEAANRAKSDFLAMMSHEIRTPMNGVLGMIDVLEDSGMSEEQRGWLATMRRSAEALLTIINDILDLSKIEAQRLELEQIDFDLRGNLADAVLLFEPRARQKGLHLLLEIGPEVPQRAIGDPTRLRQVLTNLISNAIKFTADGEVRVRVSSAALPLPADGRLRLRFAVSDSGIGIPTDKLGHIFEPFAQADGSTTRRYGGTGLGLAICKRIVELMDGHIVVHSEPGRGSTFEFDVTMKSSVLSASPAAPIPLGQLSGAPTPGVDLAPRVLVAEDNEVNQQVARLMLAKVGIRQADYVVNGLEALERAGSGEYDLILMDCLMPEMDGYAATRALRERGVRSWIVAMTANAMAGDREACLAAGMDDYLSKPLSVAALREALERWRG